MLDDARRYRAFISYSHADKGWAVKIHKALEAYKVPQTLTRRSDLGLTRGGRLGRFFRDDDELAGSPSLSASLNRAIDESANLIVICSRSAASSPWVSAEVVRFKRRPTQNRVLAVIVDGTPNAVDHGSAEDECFPLALRRIVSPTGEITATPDEPFAPDARKEPFRRLLIRLVAGLLGLSFDDLWQREQRRHRAKVLAIVSGALTGMLIIGGLLWSMRSERQSAQIQKRDEQLDAVVQAFAAADGPTGFRTLLSLMSTNYDDPVVLGLADTILSWAKTPGESISALPSPIFFSDGQHLFLKSPNVRPFEVGPPDPTRRIGLQNGCTLVIYPDRIVAVDSTHVLATLDGASEDLRTFDWAGRAFQAADGTILVAGRHFGISNSQLWDAFLVFAPGTKKLSILSLRGLGGDLWSARIVRVLPGCTTIGVAEAGIAAVAEDNPRRFLTITLRNGASPAEIQATIEGSPLFLLAALNKDDYLGLADNKEFETPGCHAATFDTLQLRDLTGLGGIIPVVDPVYSPTSTSEWRFQRGAVSAHNRSIWAGKWVERPKQPLPAPLCPIASEDCKVVDGPWKGESLSISESDEPGWVVTSMPPAGSLQGPWAAEFTSNPLLTLHVQHNAGVESAWCRRSALSAGLTCMTYRSQQEFRGPWRAIDVRSRSGRYVFYNTGVTTFPFEIFDLVQMKVASPTTLRPDVSLGAAAFSNEIDDRLFIASADRLYVFEPTTDSPHFIDVSNRLTWSGRIGSGNGRRVSALIALSGEELIVVWEDGSMSSLKWRSGAFTWSRAVPGVGVVRSVRRSPSSDALLVIGSAGMRLVRTRDGMLLSGVLVPPHLLLTGADRAACSDEVGDRKELTDSLSSAELRDGQEIIVTCGVQEYLWRPGQSTVDRVTRLQTLQKDSVRAR